MKSILRSVYHQAIDWRKPSALHAMLAVANFLHNLSDLSSTNRQLHGQIFSSSRECAEALLELCAQPHARIRQPHVALLLLDVMRAFPPCKMTALPQVRSFKLLYNSARISIMSRLTSAPLPERFCICFVTTVFRCKWVLSPLASSFAIV